MSTRNPIHTSAIRRGPLAAVLALLLALQIGASALAQDDDPILIQAGPLVERLSDIEWRFDIALRGYVSSLGAPYTPEIATQLRSLLPQYLTQRANELVLLNEASRRGIAADEQRLLEYLNEVRDSVAEGDNYEDLLAGAGFSSEAQLATMIAEADRIEQLFDQLEAEVAPSDDEVTVRFLADRALYATPETFCARHILVDEEALAQELIDRIASGEAFETLAGEHGTDGTASRGGDLGCFGRGRMVAEFEDAVVNAPVGETVGPVASQFGFHVVLVYQHDPAAPADLASVRDDVVESIVNDRVNSRLEGLLRGGGAITYPERVEAPAAQ